MKRVDKLLANSGYGSRKKVRKMVKKGRVSLGDQIIDDPGHKIGRPEQELLLVDGKPITLHETLIFMLSKPAGLITAMSDDHRKTIAECIPQKWHKKGLFPIGRLDKETEGLLLLTNDGQLANRIASPKWEIEKTYYMITQGKAFTKEDVDSFSKGFTTRDGTRFKPSKLSLIDGYEAYLTISEGQYHQVKRMAKSTGREVKYLKRTKIADLELDPNLEVGQMRLLTEEEKSALYQACKLDLQSKQ